MPADLIYTVRPCHKGIFMEESVKTEEHMNSSPSVCCQKWCLAIVLCTQIVLVCNPLQVSLEGTRELPFVNLSVGSCNI
jgi:hypothetical protein